MQTCAILQRRCTIGCMEPHAAAAPHKVDDRDCRWCRQAGAYADLRPLLVRMAWMTSWRSVAPMSSDGSEN